MSRYADCIWSRSIALLLVYWIERTNAHPILFLALSVSAAHSACASAGRLEYRINLAEAVVDVEYQSSPSVGAAVNR
jgi:Na+/serine symporter